MITKHKKILIFLKIKFKKIKKTLLKYKIIQKNCSSMRETGGTYVAGEIVQFQSAYRTYLLLRVIHVQLELVLIVRPVGETRGTSLLLI